MSPFIEYLWAPLLLMGITIGSIRFPSMNTALRLITVQLFLALVFQSVGLYFDIVDKQLSNALFFNIYMLMEICLLCGVALCYISSTALNKAIITLTSINLLVWLWDIFKYSIDAFAIHAFLVQCVLVTLSFIYILIQQLLRISRNDYILRTPQFWIAISLILYFGCNIPLFTFLQYLTDTDPHISQLLFVYINVVLCVVRYAITAYALYLAKKEVK